MSKELDALFAAAWQGDGAALLAMTDWIIQHYDDSGRNLVAACSPDGGDEKAITFRIWEYRLELPTFKHVEQRIYMQDARTGDCVTPAYRALDTRFAEGFPDLFPVLVRILDLQYTYTKRKQFCENMTREIQEDADRSILRLLNANAPIMHDPV